MENNYGFQRHLSEFFPSQIVVDITQFCNLACIHCPHPTFKKSNAFTGAHLNLDLHKKLIDEVAINGKGYCQYLRYTANGETLLHPNFKEIIEYACENSGTRINVTTNGALLNQNNISIILNAGVDVVDISIDAYKDSTYPQIRKKGDLVKVRNNVLNLLRQKKGTSTKVVVSFVQQNLNFDEVEDFKSFWEENGADFVVIRRLHSASGAKQEISQKITNKIKTIKRRACLYPWERLTITPDGFISFCPSDWVNGSHIGHYSEKSIKEIWQGDFMTKLRQAHLTNDYSCHKFCGQCPDWIQTKWPDEGESYSNMMRELIPIDLL